MRYISEVVLLDGPPCVMIIMGAEHIMASTRLVHIT